MIGRKEFVFGIGLLIFNGIGYVYWVWCNECDEFMLICRKGCFIIVVGVEVFVKLMWEVVVDLGDGFFVLFFGKCCFIVIGVVGDDCCKVLIYCVCLKCCFVEV